MTTNIALLGTCDTKLDELLLLQTKVYDSSKRYGLDTQAVLIDVGRTSVNHPDISIRQEEVSGGIDMSELSRNEVIEIMIPRAKIIVEKLVDCEPDKAIHGIVAVGGSTGTSLTASVMRDALPIGFPKLLVSTVASGDVGTLVRETDITMMYSVVDIAGCNSVLDEILSNAANAITAMADARRNPLISSAQSVKIIRKRVGITMFGVTTPCVDIARQYLERNYGYEVFVFHATGHGGIAMERLVRENRLDAVLDITTSELCDHIAGGNMSAGPDRLNAPLEAGIPYVISLGALDMVNFGPRQTVPEKYNHRSLYEHNPVITVMRTNKEECELIAKFITGKIKSLARDPRAVKAIIPRGGVSMISTPGGPFEDKVADEALFSTLEQGLQESAVEVVNHSSAINEEHFAIDAANLLAKTLHNKV